MMTVRLLLLDTYKKYFFLSLRVHFWGINYDFFSFKFRHGKFDKIEISLFIDLNWNTHTLSVIHSYSVLKLVDESFLFVAECLLLFVVLFHSAVNVFEGWRDRTPQKVMFIEDLTEIMIENFPDFWKLGQAYFSGEFNRTREASKEQYAGEIWEMWNNNLSVLLLLYTL